MKDSGKLSGNKEVMISGGQAAPLAAAVDAAKATVKKAVLLATGLNVAAGVAAGALINQGADLDDKGKAKFKDNSWGNWSARALGIVSGPGTALAINRVLAGLASTLGELTKPSLAFASNIKLDASGAEIYSTNLPPVSQGRIKLAPGNVTLHAGLPMPLPPPALPGVPPVPFVAPPADTLGSTIELTQTRVKLTNNIALLPSSLQLETQAATLATLNPAGDINLTQPVGGSVKLAAAGLTATSGISELKLDIAAGATLTGGAGKVEVKPAEVKLECAASSIEVTPLRVAINGPGDAGIRFYSVNVMLDGNLIQLG